MTQLFRDVISEVTSVTSKHRVSLSRNDSEESVSLSGDTRDHCAVTCTVIHEESLDIAIGEAAHYDLYDKDKSILLAELRDVIDAALQGTIVEQAWRDAEGGVAAVDVRLVRGGGVKTERLASWGRALRPRILLQKQPVRSYTAYPLAEAGG